MLQFDHVLALREKVIELAFRVHPHLTHANDRQYDSEDVAQAALCISGMHFKKINGYVVNAHDSQGDKVEGSLHATVLIQCAPVRALLVGETHRVESTVHKTHFVLVAD